MGTWSFLGVKSGRGVTLTPHPPSSAVVKKGQSYTSTPPLGRYSEHYLEDTLQQVDSGTAA